MFKILLLATCLVAVSSTFAQDADRGGARPDAAGTRSELEGKWRLVANSTNGGAWQKKDRDQLSPVSYMVFSGEQLRFRFKADLNDRLRGQFKIDLTTTPKHLDLTLTGLVKNGIAQELMVPCVYELKDGVLTFGVGSPDARPTKLEPSSGVELQRFERVKQDPLAKLLEGEWKLVSKEEGGKAFKAEEDTLDVWVYEDGLLINHENGESGLSVHYTIAERNGVHEIDLTDELSIFEKKPQTVLGIYSITDDTLKMCIARPAGAPRPTTFTTRRDSDTRVTILKRRDNDDPAKTPK